MGRLNFMKSPFCLIDVITIGASLVVLSGLGGRVYAASALRGLRFFQVTQRIVEWSFKLYISPFTEGLYF